ncbi:hypothetical protein [Lysinibacillus endophyticus]|uniref:hypothetical protein n=1 Tax=Ureibacillus endophyticus TaxID=1978490 RepID=UPI003135278C
MEREEPLIFGNEKELYNQLKMYGVKELKSHKIQEVINLPNLLLNKKVIILNGKL